jgi:hypothetical protein
MHPCRTAAAPEAHVSLGRWLLLHTHRQPAAEVGVNPCTLPPPAQVHLTGASALPACNISTSCCARVSVDPGGGPSRATRPSGTKPCSQKSWPSRLCTAGSCRFCRSVGQASAGRRTYASFANSGGAARLQGYYGRFHIDLPSKSVLSYTLLSRRSRHRLGCRYKRRGVDSAGHVANAVETEMILRVRRETSAFLQFRGTNQLCAPFGCGRGAPTPPPSGTQVPFRSIGARNPRTRSTTLP